MLKKMMVRAVFGGNVPPIIRELQALEAQASREGWVQSSRRQFASDALLCVVAVFAVLAAMVGAFMAGMLDSFGHFLIGEFMSARFLLVAGVMVVAMLSADQFRRVRCGRRWPAVVMPAVAACCAVYLLSVVAAITAVLACIL